MSLLAQNNRKTKIKPGRGIHGLRAVSLLRAAVQLHLRKSELSSCQGPHAQL